MDLKMLLVAVILSLSLLDTVQTTALDYQKEEDQSGAHTATRVTRNRRGAGASILSAFSFIADIFTIGSSVKGWVKPDPEPVTMHEFNRRISGLGQKMEQVASMVKTNSRQIEGVSRQLDGINTKLDSIRRDLRGVSDQIAVVKNLVGAVSRQVGLTSRWNRVVLVFGPYYLRLQFLIEQMQQLEHNEDGNILINYASTKWAEAVLSLECGGIEELLLGLHYLITGHPTLPGGESILDVVLDTPADSNATLRRRFDTVVSSFREMQAAGYSIWILAMNITGQLDRVEELVMPRVRERFAAQNATLARVMGHWFSKLILQNLDGSDYFNRTWAEYRVGFGTPNGNYWAGLNHIHNLTAASQCKLHIELQARDSRTWYYAQYTLFRVGNELTNYKLTIGGFSGTVVYDPMNTPANPHQAGTKFSTYDRDNDRSHDSNCASEYGGGFWYNYCFGFSPTVKSSVDHAFTWYLLEGSRSSWVSLSTIRMGLLCNN